MTERRAKLLAQYAQAKAAVDGSNARLRRASADRLAKILSNAEPALWVAGMRDKALTASDRAQLQRILAGRLPAQRRRLPLSLHQQLAVFLLHVHYHRRLLLCAAALTAPSLVVAIQIYCHTPSGHPVLLRGDFDMTWRLPDGVLRSEREPARTRLVLLTRNDALVLRRWFAGVGYGEIPVEPAFARQSLDAAD